MNSLSLEHKIDEAVRRLTVAMDARFEVVRRKLNELEHKSNEQSVPTKRASVLDTDEKVKQDIQLWPPPFFLENKGKGPDPKPLLRVAFDMDDDEFLRYLEGTGHCLMPYDDNRSDTREIDTSHELMNHYKKFGMYRYTLKVLLLQDTPRINMKQLILWKTWIYKILVRYPRYVIFAQRLVLFGLLRATDNVVIEWLENLWDDEKRTVLIRRCEAHNKPC